jgi:hypothetical protein
MMSRVGQLALIKSVLAAILFHQLIVLSLYKESSKASEQDVARFPIWVGRNDANGGHCHVNWDRVAMPVVWESRPRTNGH